MYAMQRFYYLIQNFEYKRQPNHSAIPNVQKLCHITSIFVYKVLIKALKVYVFTSSRLKSLASTASIVNWYTVRKNSDSCPDGFGIHRIQLPRWMQKLLHRKISDGREHLYCVDWFWTHLIPLSFVFNLMLTWHFMLAQTVNINLQ